MPSELPPRQLPSSFHHSSCRRVLHWQWPQRGPKAKEDFCSVWMALRLPSASNTHAVLCRGVCIEFGRKETQKNLCRKWQLLTRWKEVSCSDLHLKQSGVPLVFMEERQRGTSAAPWIKLKLVLTLSAQKEGGRGLLGAGQASTALILSSQMGPIQGTACTFQSGNLSLSTTAHHRAFQPVAFTFWLSRVNSASGTSFVLHTILMYTLSRCCFQPAPDSRLHSMFWFLPWSLGSLLEFCLTNSDACLFCFPCVSLPILPFVLLQSTEYPGLVCPLSSNPQLQPHLLQVP